MIVLPHTFHKNELTTEHRSKLEFRTIRLPETAQEKDLGPLGFNDNFLDAVSKAQSKKARIGLGHWN